MSAAEQPATAIVVLVPEAEPAVGDLYRAHTDAGSKGMAPHVTLLVPFVPPGELGDGVTARLRALFAEFPAFGFTLERVERWPSGVLFLPPIPSRPFVALTEAIVDAFPGYPPYGGIHDEIVPHLTVAMGADLPVDELEARLDTHLPLRCRADGVALVAHDGDLRWRVRARFALASVE